MRKRHVPSVRSIVLAATAASIALIGAVSTVLATSGGGPIPK